jgi:hypothetical protein
MEPFDILLDDRVLEYLCECEECQTIFSKVKRHVEAIENLNDDEKKLVNNLEGLVNEDDEED